MVSVYSVTARLEMADPVWVWLSLGSDSPDSVPNNWLEEESWHLLSQLQINSIQTEGERCADYQPACQTPNWVKSRPA